MAKDQCKASSEFIKICKAVGATISSAEIFGLCHEVWDSPENMLRPTPKPQNPSETRMYGVCDLLHALELIGETVGQVTTLPAYEAYLKKMAKKQKDATKGALAKALGKRPPTHTPCNLQYHNITTLMAFFFFFFQPQRPSVQEQAPCAT